MTVRLIWASLTRRFRQLALIALAVALAAGTVATLAGFVGRTAEGLGDQLAAFGPNLVVRPQVGGPGALAASDAELIRTLPGVVAAAGWSDGRDGNSPPVSTVERTVLEVHPGWKLTGAWPGEGQALLGVEAAGSGSQESTAARLLGLEIVGTLDTGGVADRTVFRGVATGTSTGGFDRIEVRTEQGRLDRVAAAIESRVAGAEARPLRRVSTAEAGLIHRLTLLLAGVSAVAVGLALIAVIAATTALMQVRRTELGLLMALGCPGRRVAAWFGLELATAALLAAVVGAMAGELASRALAIRLLGSAIANPMMTWSGPGAAALAALVVVAGSLSLAVRRSGHLDPARLLKGL